jgi:hypothetical protein
MGLMSECAITLERKVAGARFTYVLRQFLKVGIATPVLICTFAQYASAQTFVVVRRTSTEIVVGADSTVVTTTFVTDNNGKKLQSRDEEIKCKIRQAGDTFFAIAGVNLPCVDYIAEIACRDGDNYIEKAARFEAMVAKPLTAELERTRQEKPASYKEKFIGKPCLQVVFFGIENGTPAYLLASIIASNSLSDPVRLDDRVTSCPGAFPLTESVTATMGQISERLQSWLVSYSPPEGTAAIDYVKGRIAFEKLMAPEEIGGDPDIIRVKPDGAEWIYHKQWCADIEPYRPQQAQPTGQWDDRPGRLGPIGAVIRYWPAAIALLLCGIVIGLLIGHRIGKRAVRTKAVE